MATSVDYIEFVCEQIRGAGALRYRKMFGEYMVYINDKPILLVCENTVYVKKVEAISAQMEGAEVGCPYSGAKEHYVLDIENTALSAQVVALLEGVTPVPKPRAARRKAGSE